MSLSHRFHLWCVALWLGLSAAGCAGKLWEPMAQIVYPADGETREQRFSAAVERARAAGYLVDERDDAGGYLRVRARHGDSGFVVHTSTVATGPTTRQRTSHGYSTQSWLTLEVTRDGQMWIGATGHAVRNHKGTIHRRLAAEMQQFAAIVSGVAWTPVPACSEGPARG